MIQPYFAFGRQQLRVGFKRKVRVSPSGCLFRWTYHYIALGWQ